MNQPEVQTSLRPKIVLDKDELTQYTEAIMPFVLAAREAYQPIKKVREQFKFLDAEQGKIEKQIEEDKIPTAGKHPLSAALTGIKISRAELQNSPTLPVAREEFRLKANELVAEVNKWRAKFAVSANLVNPGVISLIGRPQIPPAERGNKFKRPESPVRPHNALGTLSIYREKKVRPDLEDAIREHSRVLMPSSPDAVNLSLAMVHLVPNQLVAMDGSTPADVRRPSDLAGCIVEVSRMVSRYDVGLLQPPTAHELGSRSPEQDKHIATHLEALLAHFLRDELANPNRTEKQLQGLYQKLSDYIRAAARHITPQYGQLSSSYERIGLIMEDLPGVKGPMLAARLSTNLYEDLGLPCLDYMGETRLSEVMRNIASSGHWSVGNRSQMEMGGYRILEAKRLLLSKVIESINDRLDTEELNCQKLFEAIESLDYGGRVIERLFDVLDEDQRGILFRALMNSNCFTKDLRSRRYIGDYDFDE